MAANKNAGELVRQLYRDMDTNHELNVDLLTKDCRIEMAGMGTMDPAGYAQLTKVMVSAFPDLKHQFTDVIDAGDAVGYALHVTATHKGDFNGVPPSGANVKVRGAGVAKVKNGKIESMLGVPDMLSLMQQIGAIPAPEQTA